jgi:GTP pyrophosphokinase
MTDLDSSSIRSRLPRIFSKQPSYTQELQLVIKSLKTNHPKADVSLVEKAFVAAEKAHSEQLRKSGEPYISHPVAVAQILADLGIGATTIAAALLHDTVEDTPYSLEKLRSDFRKP